MRGRSALDLDTLASGTGEWLRGTGPESDIVISTRIRLARNLNDFPFPPRASDETKASIETMLRDPVCELKASGPLHYIRVDSLPNLDRQFLVERQMISREQSEGSGPRGVALSTGEMTSVMINEEDHVRIQSLRSGMDVDACWNDANNLDDELQQKASFAFSNEFGFLTACPTNVGTGMRVSVMVHLPALVLTKEIQKVFQAMQRMGLAVRGLYGEGSQAMGDFYQISNQITLGKSEAQILGNVKRMLPDILNYERRAREAIVKDNRSQLHDKVSRSYGILQSARTITSEETMHLLSSVRLGVALGLIADVKIPDLNVLFIQTQPAHLQKLQHASLESKDRNAARAAFLREHLSHSE
jgi:protein arginine kinase